MNICYNEVGKKVPTSLWLFDMITGEEMIRLTDAESGKKSYFDPEAITAVESKFGSTRIMIGVGSFQVKEEPHVVSNLIIWSKNAKQ